MHVVFRLDSSNLIGSGHVMRCVALAQVLRDQGNTVTFICSVLVGHSIEAIKQAGFAVIEFQGNDSVAWQLDAQDLVSYLSTVDKPDWLIVDHYYLDAAWEIMVRPYVKRIAVIDDLADRDHDCDLLIDQN